jgi:hypothetical protein
LYFPRVAAPPAGIPVGCTVGIGFSPFCLYSVTISADPVFTFPNPETPPHGFRCAQDISRKAISGTRKEPSASDRSVMVEVFYLGGLAVLALGFILYLYRGGEQRQRHHSHFRCVHHGTASGEPIFFLFALC